MRQVLIICFALALLATGCTSKPADQAGTTQPNQQQTPSPSPSPQASTAPNATDSAAKGDDANKNKPADQASKPTPPPEAPKGAKEQPIVTTDQYGKVEMGMTYDEVSKAMGQMGKLINEFSEGEGSSPVQTYEYKLKDGGSVKITFNNGKVTSKSESGGSK
ncbi:hypothetical protein GCM10023310_13020 [Paenibacillus vulneris]